MNRLPSSDAAPLGPPDVYDVVVIGAGPVGENAAARVVQAGLSAVIVEGELVGGECSYYACIPSKAMLRPPTALETARSVDGARQATSDRLDAAATLSRRDRFVNGWQDEGQVGWLKSAGVDLLRGWARVTGERQVTVDAPEGKPHVVTARQAVVVATGSAASLPDIEGIDEVGAWTNREGTAATDVPGRLAVIGGGAVGAELAAAWSALGSDVTLLVRGPHLLSSWEPFARHAAAEGLRSEGVDVRTDTGVRRVSRQADGTVSLELSDGSVLTSDEVLVATGRRARTDGLGLEEFGLRSGDWLDVDDMCQVTGVPEGWLYAVGDVNHRATLTHMGKYQARACAAAIVGRSEGASVTADRYGRASATADATAVPQVLFTRPELAMVGLTEHGARERGLRVRAVEYPLGQVAGASLSADGYRGHAKMVVDEEAGVLVGCTLVGPGVGELIHVGTVAVVGEVPLERLWHAVPSFPTASEIWLRLLEEYGL
ncbi:dihydrolipoyl dehydrogenase family protein [Streptomyces tendae]